MDRMQLLKSKTFWTAIGAVCAVVGGYFAKEITAAQALTAGLLAMSQIFQRVAQQKAIDAAK